MLHATTGDPRRQQAVVLGIRGTTTLSDALTDAVGEATEAQEDDRFEKPK